MISKLKVFLWRELKNHFVFIATAEANISFVQLNVSNFTMECSKNMNRICKKLKINLQDPYLITRNLRIINNFCKILIFCFKITQNWIRLNTTASNS